MPVAPDPNDEQSLGEAWEKCTLQIDMLEVVHKKIAPDEAADLEANAFAFGLAVLEAVVAKVTHDNSEGAFECDQCAWGVRDLRQRIERLGQP